MSRISRKIVTTFEEVERAIYPRELVKGRFTYPVDREELFFEGEIPEGFTYLVTYRDMSLNRESYPFVTDIFRRDSDREIFEAEAPEGEKVLNRYIEGVWVLQLATKIPEAELSLPSN